MVNLRLIVMMFMILSALAGARCAFADGGSWEITLSTSYERETARGKQGGLRARASETTVENALEIDYTTTLLPNLEWSSSFSATKTDEIGEDSEPEPVIDSTTWDVEVETELMSEWWDVKFGWEQSVEDTNELGVDDDVEASYTIDVDIEPEYEKLPEFTFKMEGDSDTVDKTYEGVFEVDFLDSMFEFTAEADRDMADAAADDDTDNRQYSFELKFDHSLRDALKLEAEASTERTQDVTLDEDGKIKELSDIRSEEFKSKLSYALLDFAEFSIEKEITWDRDLVERKDTEVQDSWLFEASYDHSLTKKIDSELEYSIEREKSRGGGAGTVNLDKEYDVGFDYAPLDNLAFGFSYDRTDEKEWTDDSTKESSHTVDVGYTFELEGSFFTDRLKWSISQEFAKTTEDGSVTTNEELLDIEFSLEPETIPNLEITPEFTRDSETDRLKNQTDLTREWELQLVYAVDLRHVTLELDHTYKRISDQPGEGIATIEREDDTTVKVEFSGLTDSIELTAEMSREASDASEDDAGPEVSYDYSCSMAWQMLADYELKLEYDYEVPDDGADVANFTSTLSTSLFKSMLELDFEYEYEVEFGEIRLETHRYLIEAEGKF